VVWEIAKLAQLKRITINLQDQSVVRAMNAVHVGPISIDIAHASTQLGLQVDPADELIAATSIVHRVPLVTQDRKLRGLKLLTIA
jgi:PIN domain nuclease of toxin-antitoxin system